MRLRWPWQSVQIADQIERRRVDTEERLRDLQAKYDTLLAAHLAYLTPTRTSVAGSPEAMPDPAVRRPPSPVSVAIKELAQGDGRLATYFRKRANDLRGEFPGMSEEGIASLLGRWETSEPPTEGQT